MSKMLLCVTPKISICKMDPDEFIFTVKVCLSVLPKMFSTYGGRHHNICIFIYWNIESENQPGHWSMVRQRRWLDGCGFRYKWMRVGFAQLQFWTKHTGKGAWMWVQMWNYFTQYYIIITTSQEQLLYKFWVWRLNSNTFINFVLRKYRSKNQLIFVWNTTRVLSSIPDCSFFKIKIIWTASSNMNIKQCI